MLKNRTLSREEILMALDLDKYDRASYQKMSSGEEITILTTISQLMNSARVPIIVSQVVFHIREVQGWVYRTVAV